MAGVYWDPVLGQKKENPDGTVDAVMSGSYHPPGSSFKVYTLGAALRDNISVDSWWDGKSPRKFPGRTEPIKNSGASCPGGCPLWQAVQNLMNTPMFAVTMKIGQQKVIEFARDAGIHSMWAGNDRIDLVNTKASEYSKYFGAEAGIGQYPITVLDHAAGVATVAAR